MSSGESSPARCQIVFRVNNLTRSHGREEGLEKKWQRSGDPCHNCESRDNSVVAAAQAERVLPTIGGPIYRYGDKRLALIECRGYQQLMRVELDG
jgi:hypothetical protein